MATMRILIALLAVFGAVASGSASAQVWRPILSEDFGTGAANVSAAPAGDIAPGTSDYNPKIATPVDDGDYAVAKNPDFVDDFGPGFNNQWQHAGDHTTGTGYMAIFNANPGRRGESVGSYYIYSTSVTDIPGASYRVRFWATNILRFNSVGQFEAFIGFSVRENNPATGTLFSTGTIVSPLPRATGNQNNLSWVQGTANFQLPLNYNGSALFFNFFNSAAPTVTSNGNDLAIDDIVVEIANATLQGRVYLDHNANGLQDSGEAAFPQPYFVVAIAGNGKVIGVDDIDANGDFSLSTALWSIGDVGQRLVLSTTSPALGSTLTAASFPAGYALVSETPPATFGSQGANPQDGIESVLRTNNATSNITGFNFGLRKLPIIRLQKQLAATGRFAGADQFVLSIAGAGGPAAVTTTGTGTTASGTATINPATVGSAYTLSESAAAGANLANYSTTYSCTNASTRPGAQAPSGSAASFTVTPVAEDDLTCSFLNTRSPLADLSITKTNTPADGVSDRTDDTVMSGAPTTYSLRIVNAGPDAVANAVVRDVPGAGLTCPGSATVGCSATSSPAGATVCPAAAALTTAQLFGAGIAIPALGVSPTPATPNNSITLTVSCTVN